MVVRGPNGTEIGTTTVTPSNNFTFTASTTGLPSGTSTITVVQTSPQGATSSPTKAGTVTIPNPPVVQGFSGSRDTINVWGKGDPNTNVTVYSNGTAIGYGYIDDGGSFNVTGTGLSLGSHNITVSAANNVSASNEVGWGISIGPPLFVVSPPNPPVSFGTWLSDGSGFNVNGTGEPGNTVNLYANEVSVGWAICDGRGYFAISSGTSLSVGGYNMSIAQTNGVFTSGGLPAESSVCLR